MINAVDGENKTYFWKKYNKQSHSQKKEENQQAEEVRKTKAGNIIRDIEENQWECDGNIGEKKNLRKTYKCLICFRPGVRSDNRKVHSCSANFKF